MLDMEAIVRDTVEAGLKDWGRGLGVGLEPKEKTAWDRLGNLKNAVKALPTMREDALTVDRLKKRCLAAIKDARRIISTGGVPETHAMEVGTNNVIEYFKDPRDPKLRSGLDAIGAALPLALDAIRAVREKGIFDGRRSVGEWAEDWLLDEE